MTALKADLKTYARRILERRRRDLLVRSQRAENQAQELFTEREPDWEDRAANLRNATDLEQLSEAERVQLARVVAALARLDGGEWGTCAVCGKSIAARRLRAVPETTRCSKCTDHE